LVKAPVVRGNRPTIRAKGIARMRDGQWGFLDGFLI
jgi:hypothetical protein